MAPPVFFGVMARPTGPDSQGVLEDRPYVNVHFLAFEEAAGFGGAFVDLAHIALELRRRGARVLAEAPAEGVLGVQAPARVDGVVALERVLEVAEEVRAQARARKRTVAVRANRRSRKSLFLNEMKRTPCPQSNHS